MYIYASVFQGSVPHPRDAGASEKGSSPGSKERHIAKANNVNTSVCQMTFHLTDANKILASVTKMTAAGNEVIFNNARSYIKSPAGRKAFLRKRNGVYVLDVIFFNGDEAVRGELTTPALPECAHRSVSSSEYRWSRN